MADKIIKQPRMTSGVTTNVQVNIQYNVNEYYQDVFIYHGLGKTPDSVQLTLAESFHTPGNYVNQTHLTEKNAQYFTVRVWATTQTVCDIMWLAIDIGG